MQKFGYIGLFLIGCLLAFPSCRRKFESDERLPSREIMIRFCWQTFDLALKDKNDFIQNAALRTLGRLGNKAAVETIRSVDLGGKRATVKTAVYTLSQIQDSAAYLALAGYTRSSDFQIRELAVLGLTRMSALYDDSVTVRILKRTLAELDSLPLDSMMYDSADIQREKAELRAKIAVALLKFGVTSARRYVESSYLDPEFQFRAAMVRIIGEIRPSSAMALLLPFERDRVDYVRTKVVEAWSKIGTPDAMARIRVATADGSPPVQATAAAELLRFDESAAVPVLLALLRSPDDDIRSRVILALGDTRERRAQAAVADSLRGLLDDPVDLIRVVSVGSLGKLGDTLAVSRIEKLLNDPSDDVREIAVGVLSRLRGAAMLDRLTNYLKDDQYAMREVAIAGLGSLTEPGLQERLIALVYDRMRNDDEMTVRIRAAFTLLDMLHDRKYTKSTSIQS